VAAFRLAAATLYCNLFPLFAYKMVKGGVFALGPLLTG
jgi:hypothetical protein